MAYEQRGERDFGGQGGGGGGFEGGGGFGRGRGKSECLFIGVLLLDVSLSNLHPTIESWRLFELLFEERMLKHQVYYFMWLFWTVD